MQITKQDIDILTGKTDGHLVDLNTTSHSSFKIHKNSLKDLNDLIKDAEKSGIELTIASAFRNYERQKTIWNEKATGKRDILDKNGVVISYESLSKKELLYSILRWSAIPGTSRHHWGTDFDIIDAIPLKETDYKIQLTEEETKPEGIFGKLHQWLDKAITNNNSHNFYRPYDVDRGGVSPEMWHISHYPTASRFEEIFSLELFTSIITNSDIMLKELILNDAEEIFNNFVINVSRPKVKS